MESGINSPESKTLLDYLTWGDTYALCHSFYFYSIQVKLKDCMYIKWKKPNIDQQVKQINLTFQLHYTDNYNPLGLFWLLWPRTSSRHERPQYTNTEQIKCDTAGYEKPKKPCGEQRLETYSPNRCDATNPPGFKGFPCYKTITITI